MTKKEIIELIVEEIIKNVSTKIREIIREEIDIERKKIRKQLFEEFGKNENKKLIPTKNVKIDTGNSIVNSILDDIEVDEEAFSEIKFNSKQIMEDVSKQIIESKNNDKLWKPPPGEGYNFDPRKMDPTKIDWGPMIDALEGKSNNNNNIE